MEGWPVQEGLGPGNGWCRRAWGHGQWTEDLQGDECLALKDRDTG